jgi:hypothetical protein
MNAGDSYAEQIGPQTAGQGIVAHLTAAIVGLVLRAGPRLC